MTPTSDRGSGSPLDSCWLVVAGVRHGPMPFERAVERLHAFHRKGVALADLTIVQARHRRKAGIEPGATELVGTGIADRAHHGVSHR